MKILIHLITCAALLTTPTALYAQKKAPAKKKTKVENHDTGLILMDKELWKLPIYDFYQLYRGYKFQWQTAAKKSVRSEGKTSNLFGLKAGEIVVKSEDDLVKYVIISLFNKGDDAMIGKAEFDKMKSDMEAKLTEKLGVSGKDLESSDAANTRRKIWEWNDSAFVLESAISGSSAEYVRVRVSSIRTARRGTKTANKSDLKSNVTYDKATGDVYIDNIPMIDQGQKGYCACASAARIYQYYGLTIGQHEIAKMAGSSAEGGTSIIKMVEALKNASRDLDSRVLILYEYPKNMTDKENDYRKWAAGVKDMMRDVNSYQKLAKKNDVPGFQVQGEKEYARIPSDMMIDFSSFYKQCDAETFREIMMQKSSFKRWQSKLKEYINQGIPVGWCLLLGKFKEPNLPQMDGGHMRLIIGYNEKTNEIIYSDSWGAGHAKKSMDAGNAFVMTSVSLVLPPKK